jgi:outer membrane protein TolC
VLDAQKDLTSATRRSVAVAGQVVTAMADLRHALGIPQDDKAK